MTYAEMQLAEAEYLKAIAPQKKQRGASKAQLAYRAKFLTRELCVSCGMPFNLHTPRMTYECAMNRS